MRDKNHYIFFTPVTVNKYLFLTHLKVADSIEIVLQANEHRNEWFEGVHKCKATDSLGKVMETIVKAEVRK